MPVKKSPNRRRQPKVRPKLDPIELLNPRDLAAKLGWTDNEGGERLKRAVFAAEREQGVRIFVREGSEKRPAYKATVPALRKWLPQLFARSKVDDLAKNLRQKLLSLEEQVDKTIADRFAEDVKPHLRQIRSQVSELRTLVLCFDSRLKAIEARSS